MTDTIADPFAQPANLDDPFATPEDTKGGSGSYVPSPSVEALAGRLVAFIPRKFEKRAPKPVQFQKDASDTTRERYTVDLYVLDKGEFRFWYNAKVEGQEERVPTEHVVEASEIPFHVPNYWIVQDALVGQIRKVDGGPRPILAGRVRRGPQAKDRDKKTFDSIEREWAAYVARNMQGTKPKFSWQIDNNMTPEDLYALRNWWTGAGIELTKTEVID